MYTDMHKWRTFLLQLQPFALLTYQLRSIDYTVYYSISLAATSLIPVDKVSRKYCQFISFYHPLNAIRLHPFPVSFKSNHQTSAQFRVRCQVAISLLRPSLAFYARQ